MIGSSARFLGGALAIISFDLRESVAASLLLLVGAVALWHVGYLLEQEGK